MNIIFKISLILFFCVSSKSYSLTNFGFIKSKEVNVRNGPDEKYNIIWKFNVKNTPVQIINKIDNWYMIRDYSGEVGWIKSNLIATNKKKRYGIITKRLIKLCHTPTSSCTKIGLLDKNTVVRLISCGQKWCRIAQDNKTTGWINKNSLWGILKNEEF